MTYGLQEKLVFQYLKRNQSIEEYKDILNLFDNSQVDINWLIENIE